MVVSSVMNHAIHASKTCAIVKHISAHGSAHYNLEDMNMDKTHHEHHKQGYSTPSSIDQAQEQRKEAAAHKKNTVAAICQHISKTSEQLTLQRDSSLDHGVLDLPNHEYVISIHGTSHQGLRIMLRNHQEP